MNATTRSDDIEKNKGMAIAACFIIIIFFLPLSSIGGYTILTAS